MNICKTVLECIDQYPEDEPIFIEEIKKYVIEKCKEDEKENVLKNINVILNRLKNEGIIKAEYKGVYYKPAISMFGEVPLNTERLRELKYLVDRNGNIKGYIVGAKLFNIIGLTTQVPNVTDIVTNENYKYLQFIDILENKDNINIEVENVNEILYQIIQEYNLDFETIIKYARETNSRKILDKLFVLAR